MGLLEVSFLTVDGASNIHHNHCVSNFEDSDFEDIIRLDFCQPCRWICRERAATDFEPTPTALRADNRYHREGTEYRETESWESEIVRFRRKD